MEVNLYPEPNPALSQALLSPRMREICFERAQTAQFLYQSRVAKRTGALAESARGYTEIGGRHHDRWIGVVLVGFGLVYDAPHEFGYTTAPSARSPEGHPVLGAHDLNAVLEELGST